MFVVLLRNLDLGGEAGPELRPSARWPGSPGRWFRIRPGFKARTGPDWGLTLLQPAIRNALSLAVLAGAFPFFPVRFSPVLCRSVSFAPSMRLRAGLGLAVAPAAGCATPSRQGRRRPAPAGCSGGSPRRARVRGAEHARGADRRGAKRRCEARTTRARGAGVMRP